MNRRKVGLSKAQKPSPLLKQVNGRERKTGPSSKTEDIFAPPESSSDEEELEETPNDAISSSEDDLSRSADIFTTKFITRPVGKNRGKYGRKSRPQSGGETVESPPLRRSKRQRRGAEDIEDEESVEAAVGDSKTANDGSRGDQSTDSASHPSNRLPWAPGHKVIRTFSARDKNRPVKEAASLVQRGRVYRTRTAGNQPLRAPAEFGVQKLPYRRPRCSSFRHPSHHRRRNLGQWLIVMANRN